MARRCRGDDPASRKRIGLIWTDHRSALGADVVSGQSTRVVHHQYRDVVLGVVIVDELADEHVDDVHPLAMHVVLEQLSPAERTAFVLHDVFQYRFEEIAAIVGRSAGSCRQLASRARRALRAASAVGRFPVNPARERQLSERFIAACAGGDIATLLTLLDPEVEPAGDVLTEPVTGAGPVATAVLRYLGPPASPALLRLPVGDRSGIVALRGHQVLALVVLTVRDGRIVHLDALAGAGPRRAVAAALGLDG